MKIQTLIGALFVGLIGCGAAPESDVESDSMAILIDGSSSYRCKNGIVIDGTDSVVKGKICRNGVVMDGSY